jgi:HEPN domain-containing protein
MVDRDIIEEWLTKAGDDFEFARINLEEDKPFFAQICFHFHQAAEKYFKAYIIANELEFRRIHDLVWLANHCRNQDSTFEIITEDSEYLNTFYIETRYPVQWPTDFSKDEATNAFQAAGNIRKLILKKLSVV